MAHNDDGFLAFQDWHFALSLSVLYSQSKALSVWLRLWKCLTWQPVWVFPTQASTQVHEKWEGPHLHPSPGAICNGPGGLASSHRGRWGWKGKLCPELNSAQRGGLQDWTDWLRDSVSSFSLSFSLVLSPSFPPSVLPSFLLSLMVSCENKRIKKPQRNNQLAQAPVDGTGPFPSLLLPRLSPLFSP